MIEIIIIIIIITIIIAYNKCSKKCFGKVWEIGLFSALGQHWRTYEEVLLRVADRADDYQCV